MSSENLIPPGQERALRAHAGKTMDMAPGSGRDLEQHALLLGASEINRVIAMSKERQVSVLVYGAGARGVFETQLTNKIREEGGRDPFLTVMSPTFTEESGGAARVLEGLERVPSAVVTSDLHTEISAPSGFYDAIFMVNVFQHLPPDGRNRALEEVWRTLKEGGVLSITPVLKPKAGEETFPWKSKEDAEKELQAVEEFIKKHPEIEVERYLLPTQDFILGQTGNKERKNESRPFDAFCYRLKKCTFSN